MESNLRMDNSHTKQIEETIVGVLTGQASAEELAEVRKWLAESEANRSLYDEYAHIWRTSLAIGRDADYQPDKAWSVLSKQMDQQAPQVRRIAWWVKVAMVAAVFAIVFLTGLTIWQLTKNDAGEQSVLSYTEYTSPYGSKSKIKLPDGSSVWLNSGSTLRHSSVFNVSNREVHLEGEGYFDVTFNEHIPFIVQTSAVTIKVVGTAFNVKAYPEEASVETTVERGAVQLIDPLSSSPETTILYAKQKAVVMKANQPERKVETVQTSAYVPIADVKVNNNVATETYTSWKDSRWIIEREKLASLAIKLERRYNVRIVFSNEELKEYVFSGTFENETLDQVLEVVKLTAPIFYEVKQNTVYLSRNKAYNP